MALIIQTTPGDTGFDMRDLNFDALIAGHTVTGFNPFIVQWKPATGTNSVSLFGDDMDPQVSGGVLQGLTGTQVTQILVVADNFALNYAGMILDVDAFMDLLQAKDWRGLAGFVRQGDDSIVGTANNDMLLGGDGDDRFVASLGRDVMNGGRGNDTMIATEGHDVMIGGRGADAFEFAETPSDDAWVVIKDFTHGTDRIYVHDISFNHVGFGGFDGAALEAQHFGYGKQARSADQGLIYDKAKGFLYHDADGSGSLAARVLMARLGAGTDLTFEDFWVV